jgi:hypothetical protein
MRNITILACLVLSAVLGAAAILLHRWALQTVIFYVFCVWMLADLVVSGVFSQRYWKARNVPISQLYHDAKEGRELESPRRRVAIGRVTRVGSMILMLIFIALYFIR